MEQKSLHVQVAQVAYFCVWRWILLGVFRTFGGGFAESAGIERHKSATPTRASRWFVNTPDLQWIYLLLLVVLDALSADILEA
jgi:hypothetical protein